MTLLHQTQSAVNVSRRIAVRYVTLSSFKIK